MEFSRQEFWSGLPFPSPRDLPDPGIESRDPALQADALPPEPPGKAQNNPATKTFCAKINSAELGKSWSLGQHRYVTKELKSNVIRL